VNEKYLENAKKQVADRRVLINGVSKRAAELARGGRSLVPLNPAEERNCLDIALLEVAEGKLEIRQKNV
jgi:DNA-directed RNA polymerase subunit K/omega